MRKLEDLQQEFNKRIASLREAIATERKESNVMITDEYGNDHRFRGKPGLIIRNDWGEYKYSPIWTGAKVFSYHSAVRDSDITEIELTKIQVDFFEYFKNGKKCSGGYMLSTPHIEAAADNADEIRECYKSIKRI